MNVQGSSELLFCLCTGIHLRKRQAAGSLFYCSREGVLHRGTTLRNVNDEAYGEHAVISAKHCIYKAQHRREMPWLRANGSCLVLRHGPLRPLNARLLLEALACSEAYKTSGLPSVVMSFKIGPEGMGLAAKSPTIMIHVREGTPKALRDFKCGLVTI